jgi:hypothetical protein
MGSLAKATITTTVCVCFWLAPMAAAQVSSSDDRFKAVEDTHVSAAHRFFDKPGKIVNGANVSLAALDAVGTCRTLAAGGVENWLPTQHCAPASVLIAGGGVLDIGIAYLFHRTGHHKLERIMEIVGCADSLEGVAYTTTHGGRW